MTDPAASPTVAIVGSGFAGLAMAMWLQRAGIKSFTIFEKTGHVGGTWRDNTYPGAACDVPSHLYSLSFESRMDWSRVFPTQSEVLSYIRQCVHRHGLRPHICFNTEIDRACFDEARCRWHLWTIHGKESPIGCKRILLSNDYYPALCRPNVELVTSPIERARNRGLMTRDGSIRKVDAVIYGTGFQSTDFLAPMKIVGRHGLDLRDSWRNGAEAYLGIAVSGFPNLFLLYGPNTNLGHNSILFMIECQVRYTIRCISRLRKQRLASLEVRAGTMRRFNQRVQERHAPLVWTDCASWYRHESGRHTNNWPGSTITYWWRTRRPHPAAFHVIPRADQRRPSGCRPARPTGSTSPLVV